MARETDRPSQAAQHGGGVEDESAVAPTGVATTGVVAPLVGGIDPGAPGLIPANMPVGDPTGARTAEPEAKDKEKEDRPRPASPPPPPHPVTHRG